ncbi:hypothetical protein CapIbe_002403 [Capra ibex]
MPGASAKFFVRLTCSFAFARPLRTPPAPGPRPMAEADPRPATQRPLLPPFNTRTLRTSRELLFPRLQQAHLPSPTTPQTCSPN